jgi:hypothetical protein
MTQVSTSAPGRLTVLAGAEQGSVYVLGDEIVQIGTGPDNQLVLHDSHIAEQHCSVVRRGGRFAIYAQPETGILIDGRPLPVDQWVWLPPEAVLQLSPQTVVYFSATGRDLAAPTPELTPTSPSAEPAPVRSGARKKAKKGEKSDSRRQTARFITDRSGETLVRLGEDGQLPELSLADVGSARRADPRKNAQGNPVLVYAALAFSVLASVVLLILEPEIGGPASSRAGARTEIVREFIGQPGEPLKPHQQLLREATLAHSRGDSRSEREALRNVLQMLNSEDRNPFVGLTGRLEDDERLRQLIAVLLAP